MKKCCFLLFLSIIVFLNFSCKKTDITPAYLLLHIEDFQDCIDVSNLNNQDRVYTQEELNIIKHQDFKDALVSLNGKELGFWKLEQSGQRPCRIPLLPDYSQTNNIRVIPCVRTPSTTLTTVPYHFLISVPEEHLLDIEEGGEYRLSNLKFQYRAAVKFPVLETFVQDSRFVSIDSVHGANLEIDRIESVGKIVLSDSLPYFNIVIPYIDLPGQGSKIFWEIYYQCDGEMTTYLNFRNSATFDQDMIVLPSTRGAWKKVYIDLTEEVSYASGYATNVSTRLGIRGNRNSSSQSAYFHFGHMKLITMPSY